MEYLVVPYANGWRIILDRPADGSTWSLTNAGGFENTGQDVRVFESRLQAFDWIADRAK